MGNNQRQNPERKFSQRQYEMLMRCSKDKNMMEWNQWRGDNPDEDVLLEGVILSKPYVKGADLYLMGADLHEAHLEGADLHDGHLESANLFKAHLQGANLRFAHLKGAFLCGVNWESAELQGADLDHADLRGDNFRGANLENANLESANLYGAHLEDAILGNALLKNANLDGAILKGANLVLAHLEGSNLFRAHLEGADLGGARLDGADMRNVYLGVGEEKEKRKEQSSFTSFSGTLFGDAIFSLADDWNGDSEKAIQALSRAEVNNVRFINPVFGRRARDEAWLCHYKQQCKGHWRRKVVNFVWRTTCDYGRSFIRWAIVSLLIALLFGAIYLHFSPYASEKSYFNFSGYPEEKISPVAPFYYSIVTFTTLGFGDITPKMSCWWAQVIVTIEVVLGYIMLGGLISIFANKLAKRND